MGIRTGASRFTSAARTALGIERVAAWTAAAACVATVWWLVAGGPVAW